MPVNLHLGDALEENISKVLLWIIVCIVNRFNINLIYNLFLFYKCFFHVKVDVSKRLSY